MPIEYKYTQVAKGITQTYFKKVVKIIAVEFKIAQEKLIKDSPEGVSKLQGLPDLKSNWNVGVEIQNLEVRGVIRNDVPRAINRLEGRKAGKQPPSSALEPWVGLKLKVPKKKIKSVAFLIARKIGKKGTQRSKRAAKQFRPETGEPLKNSAIGVASRRIKKAISELRILPK